MSSTNRGRKWTGLTSRQPSLLRPFPSLRCEELESRLAPATFTWTGAAGDGKWSTANNWAGTVAPTGSALVVDDLVFPAGPTFKAAVNDLPAGSTFNSITYSGIGYTLSGNPIILGRPDLLGSGFLVVGSGASGNTLAINTQLGASAGSDQTFSVEFGGDLVVSGKLSGTTGSTLTKDRPGTLHFTADNSGFTGSIRLNASGGTLDIGNRFALGTTTAPTSVGTNATLAVTNVAGVINEPLILDGLGLSNVGALNNLAGNNTWNGSITLNSNTAIGSAAGQLNITGVIDDAGAGWNLIKKGVSEVQLGSPTGNTYRGITFVNDGILTVTHPLSLGASGAANNGTIVTQTLTEAGQLRMKSLTGVGFTIANEFLTLNGAGITTLANKGSLTDTAGDNTWAGPVTLGSPNPDGVDVTIGAATGINMTISGVISSPNGAFQLIKVDLGRVILNNANTYTGFTTVQEGILNIRDSKALGATTSGTAVLNGAALEMQVEASDPVNIPQFDFQGRDLGADSVTNDPHRLWSSEPLSIQGRGVGNTGALRSISGINRWIANVTLDGTVINLQDAIGVDSDLRLGHPTPDTSYFVSDYSLTVGDPATGKGVISGGDFTDFIKRGTGQLILPIANTYTGITRVEQGWVTIQNNRSLGADYGVRTYGPRTFATTDQPGTVVSAGAAVHIRSLIAGTPLSVPENIAIQGNGITHPYSFISQKGALMNIDGDNTWTGGIGLLGQAGIGVETVIPGQSSSLTVTGSVHDGQQNYTFRFNGLGTEQSMVVDTLGAVSKSVPFYLDFLNTADRLSLYYPLTTPRLAANKFYDSNFITGSLVNAPNYNPSASTQMEVVLNEGGGGSTIALGYIYELTLPFTGGIEKFGSQRLLLQGDDPYSGATNLREGTIRVQNDNALGLAQTTTAITQQTFSNTDTVVSGGAVLELSSTVAALNGGIAAGVQTWNEHLVLNAPGQQIGIAGAGGTFTLTYPGGGTTAALPITITAAQLATAITGIVPANLLPITVTSIGTGRFSVIFGAAQAPNVAGLLIAATSGGAEVTVSGGNAPLTTVAANDDVAWRGPVTLNAGTRINSVADSRINIFGSIDDATNAQPSGSDLVKRGAGDLDLAGANTFRGTTLIDVGVLTALNSNAFGATTSGTVVSNGAQLQIQGSLSIAGEPLTIQGSGVAAPPNFPNRWFNTGPAPADNGNAPQNMPTSGRIASVTVDPSNPSVFYVAAAGGGVWKTVNSGLTWTPLFDDPLGGQIAMYGGSLSVAPTNSNTLYYATGESNGAPNGLPIGGQQDNFAGTGVYRSTDGGVTWTLLGGAANPIAGQAVTKLIVDPTDSTRIYVATSTVNLRNGIATAVPGVYRFSAGAWLNITATVSPNRNGTPGQAPFDAPTGGNGPPRRPGPDDDYRIDFPQTTATWSDIALVYTTNVITGGNVFVLYAALGESTENNFSAGTGTPPPIFSTAIRNGVYRTEDPTSATPTWWNGPGSIFIPTAPDGRPGGFPIGDVTVANGGRNGYIKLTAIRDTLDITTTVYASVVRPDIDATGLFGELLDIQKSTVDGTWAAVATQAAFPTAPFGNAVAFVTPATGRYNNVILGQDYNQNYRNPAVNPFIPIPVDSGLLDNNPNVVYLAGLNAIYRSTNGGVTWAAITPDASGRGPAANFHSLALDPGNRLLSASDGGIWRWNGTTFVDLNDNLPITQFNAVDPHPTDINQAVGGSQDNGTLLYNGGLAWTRTDPNGGLNSGIVRYDPKFPSTIYAVRDGVLRKTTNGGTTWSSLVTVAPLQNYFPMIVDPNNTSRLLIGTNDGTSTIFGLNESVNGGASFVNLVAGIGVTAIGNALYQGTFVADAGFPTVIDKLTNTYDPDTIYITNGTTFRVTKNHGVSWVTRNVTGLGAGTITDIAVDPSNRDTVYVTVTRAFGVAGGRVFRSTDAGQTWTNITGTIPTMPTWKIIIDPRSGTAYVGNDNGVWTLPNAGTTATFTWTRFGSGLPRVSVHDIVLNQTLNTLTLATYGRSMYQLVLSDYEANSGAIREVSGASQWTGPVTLVGDTVFGAAGTQNVQNGIAASSLNILGIIADNPTGANYLVQKTGPGTLTFSGNNTYGGQTQILEGVLQVNNPHALGAATVSGNTIVLPTSINGRPAISALELRTDLELEPVTVNGDGFKFNGHFTGALRNVSNINTYSGPLTLATNTTIGVDSGTALTIGARTGLAGSGNITDGAGSFSIDKELPGLLTFATKNTYDGLTRVVQGPLQVQDTDALGTPGVGTQVLDGAALQISRNSFTLAETTVAAEPLFLSGTGIFGTGALRSVRGDSDPTGTNNNTWQGPITFTILPNFFPTTNPGTQIAIGVADGRDILTLDTIIGQDSTLASFGMIKVGPGRETLTKANTYTGVTNINGGTVRLLDPLGLGPVVSSEVQTLDVVGVQAGTTYTLTFNGKTTPAQPFNASAATIQTALQGLSTIGAGNVLVTETPTLIGKVFTVTFKGALANQNVPQIVPSLQANLSVNPATSQQGGLGTVVAAGAGLELDGDPLGIASNIAVNEVLTLNGDGVNNAGALNDVTGNNTYSGLITLGSDASIGATATTLLTVTGTVQDPTPLLVAAPRLRKAGTGTVLLPNADQYSGRTVVDEGVLRFTNPLALGVGRSEVQTISLFGTAGTFTVTFNGATTAALPFNVSAGALSTALFNLASVSGVGGTVTVNPVAVQGGTRMDITFGGTLANTNLPVMTTTTAGGAIAIPATTTDGTGAEAQNVSVVGTNGTFTLSFNGSTTTSLPFNANAAAVQAALNLLPSIASVGANVTVTGVAIAGGTLFTVVFGGNLNDANLPSITAAVTGGTVVIVTTIQDGPEGTSVTSGATLQIAGGITQATEVVTLNGAGFNGQGALNNFSGNNVWNIPTPLVPDGAFLPRTILGSNSSIGTTNAGETLTFTSPITDSGTPRNLDIVGPGTVTYAATVDNRYFGTTTVKAGTLLLSQPTGLAIRGPLVVGGQVTTALAQETLDNQIEDTVPVTVNVNGTFDLNGRIDTINNLTVNKGLVLTGPAGQLTTALVSNTDGTITVGAGGKMTSNNITLTGGTINIGAAGQVVMNGNLSATSDALGVSTVAGPGDLFLNGLDRTLTVPDGPNAEDVRISAEVTSAGTERLIKLGAGRATFFPATAFATPVEVQVGDVQVDTAIGDVRLSGGSLSGTGTVGIVGGSPTGTPAVGTVTPGNNWQANPAGILSSADETWGPQTTFFVNLNSSAHPTGVAGTDYDLLQVTGNIALGGATLDGTFGPGILFGDSFTIITATGTISGKFAEPYGANVVFIQGQKFSVTYNANSVVLEKIRALATVGVATTANPATIRQPITFTATVFPEAGAGPIPNTTTVTFTLTGPFPGSPQSVTRPVVTQPDGTGKATFTPTDPIAFGGLGLAFLPATAPFSTYQISALFNGDPLNFNPANGILAPDERIEVPTIQPITANPLFLSPNNSPGVQDTVSINTTVTEERSASTWSVSIVNGSGTVVKTFTGNATISGNTFPIGVVWDGKNGVTNAFVPDGVYRATASFVDIWGNTQTTAPINITVDNTSPVVTVTAPVNPSPIIAPGTAAQVPTTTPLTGIETETNPLSWTIVVTDAGGAIIRTFNSVNPSDPIAAVWNGRDVGGAVVPDGTYTVTISAVDQAGNPSTTSTGTVIVLTHPPAITLTSNAPTVYGQAITLTSTISLPAGVAGVADRLIGNTVQFFDGISFLGTGTITKIGAEYKASITVPTFAAGAHGGLTVTYPGTVNFLPATSTAYTHFITPAALRVTAEKQTKVYGTANPTLTYVVEGLVNNDVVANVIVGAPATNATINSGVGSYPITQGNLAANTNYTLTFVNRTLTVTPAALTVKVNDQTKNVRTANPPLTLTVDGLLLGDTAAVIDGLTVSTTATTNSPVGRYPITVTGIPSAQNYTVTILSAAGVLTVLPVPLDIVVGTGAGSAAVIKVYAPDGNLRSASAPFDGGFTGGIRTATADFNGDNATDYVVGTGPGRTTLVTVFDGATRRKLFEFQPFEDSFTGGVYVATGDVNGDGVPDFAVTPDEGGGPRVRVFDGKTFTQIADFLGIDDPDFRGGARAAIGDMNGDGKGDLIISAGFLGGPRIAGFSGAELARGNFVKVFGDFFAFEPALRNGAFVAAGDVNGDGFGDLVAGGGPGGGPRVFILDGKTLTQQGSGNLNPIANFFGGNTENRGGIRVAVKNLDGDPLADVVVGDGAGAGSHVTSYTGKSLLAKPGDPAKNFEFDVTPGDVNGVFVG